MDPEWIDLDAIIRAVFAEAAPVAVAAPVRAPAARLVLTEAGRADLDRQRLRCRFSVTGRLLHWIDTDPAVAAGGVGAIVRRAQAEGWVPPRAPEAFLRDPAGYFRVYRARLLRRGLVRRVSPAPADREESGADGLG